MNLFQNPFYIIGINTRNSKQTIVEICDAKSLTFDADFCTRYRSVLTHPRNRLSAELAWLPGFSPVGAQVLIEKIEKDPNALLSSLDGIAPLARCNALITYIDYHKPKEGGQISKLFIEIALSFDHIDHANLLTVINEDRQIAKIPVIQDIENIKQEMKARREYIVGTMINCLNNTNAPDKVMTEVVAKTTSDGTYHPSLLIEELTDKYQIEVQKYLDQLAGQIRNVISTIKEQPKKTFDYQMPNLYKYLKTWYQIAQPIQLVHQSKGKETPHSKELAKELRGLTLEIANSYSMHSEAKQITVIISKIFKELPQVADNFSEDLTALGDIINQKAKSKEEDRKWRAECSLDIVIGRIFKKRFMISPDMIRFKDDLIPTDKVDSVRWGILVDNNIYSYSVWIGYNQKTFHVEPADRNQYNMIIDKLWKAVCVRLIGDTLKILSAGESVAYGNYDAIVNRDGVMLKKPKMFGYEPYYSKWEDLRISNGNGTFIISSASEKEAKAELSYMDINNAHILETIMRFLWKDGNFEKLRRGELS
ncbi:MAG: hypothetical protein HQL01_06875 [Nitrospirae bacterium]|nr:hypothetical protein [Nitrospirota bacterium]